MAQITGIYVFTPNTVISSTYVNANNSNIVNVYNAHDIAKTAVHGLTGGLTIVNSSQTIPIGSIIPFYDYNGALTFDTTYWAYCNGQTKTVGGAGSQVLPDLSNRYLVGFGTEGGTDNGSAAWATAAVGNANHQIDLSQVGKAHTHTYYYTYNHTHTYSGTTGAANFTGTALFSPGVAYQPSHTHNYSGTTSNPSTGTDITNTSSSGTAGSATQTIQPRSISVRYIMRIL